jgi:hypothetical protein
MSTFDTWESSGGRNRAILPYGKRPSVTQLTGMVSLEVVQAQLALGL